MQRKNCPRTHLPFPTWRALERLRTGVSRCYSNIKRWGHKEDDTCECGAIQDPQHLTICPNMGESCTGKNLITATDKVTYVADFESKKINMVTRTGQCFRWSLKVFSSVKGIVLKSFR
ncbi:hypothetical protein JTB14_027142 [Gonioctena quinquepunctata]|nr:hypothetical protein JTB14_027142 [Gonioctena quinquepunctata]